MAASSHLSSCSTTASTPFCAVAPAPSPSDSGHGTRSSPSAASRTLRQRTPSLAARASQTARFAPRQSCHNQGGLIFRPAGISTFPSGAASGTVPEPFSYLARRFLHARDRWRHHRCHRLGSSPVNGHRHRGWTSDLFSFQTRPELGGSPVDTCLHPWAMVRPVRCTPITLYSTCI